jgi:hypothetical protein
MIEDWQEINLQFTDANAPIDLIAHPTKPDTLVFDNGGTSPNRYPGLYHPRCLPSKSCTFEVPRKGLTL